MKVLKTKYFYFFRGTLATHVQFFEAIRDVCSQNNVPIKLITFLKPNVYIKQFHLVKKYRDKSFKIFITPIPYYLTTIIYFFIATMFSKRTVVHIKKRNPESFQSLKKIFGNKLILITDLEGDRVSEEKYLRARTNNKAHYFSYNKNFKEMINDEKHTLSKYDIIFVQNGFFKELLEERHPNIKSKIYISHLMSFKKGNLIFDENLRRNYREKLKWNKNYIITYIGNVYYPWQNLSKTIQIYKRVKNELYSDAKLLLLIREADHNIAEYFITKFKLNSTDYHLNEVHHNEINGYLNASDLGVVLRDFHEMNKVVTSGKLLDYLGSGLPVITTSVIENIANQLKANNYGLVLDYLDVENIPIGKVKETIELDSNKRKEISNWANDNLSLNATITDYIKELKNLNH